MKQVPFHFKKIFGAGVVISLLLIAHKMYETKEIVLVGTGQISRKSSLEKTVITKTDKSVIESNEVIILWSENVISHLEKWLLMSNHTDRKKIVDLITENPVQFAIIAKELLEQLPDDQTESRKQLLSLMIDGAEYVNQSNDTNMTKEYFEISHQVVLKELSSEELIKSDMIEKLTHEQKDSLAHAGQVVEKNNEYYRSTLEPKVMSILLTAQDPKNEHKNTVLETIQNSTNGNADSYTSETLLLVAQQNLVRKEL